jgi:hypothetical protein
MNVRAVWRGLAVLTFVITCLVARASPSSTQPAPEPRVPTGWTFRFPDGDAKAGQTVFMTMQCYRLSR